jgi:cobalt-precorrin-5B (C1)-methyltransferase
LIDMGDFVGGMLKYLRKHPVTRVTIAGGVAKMTKLAQGLTDLHSRRGEVDFATLAGFAAAAGGSADLCARIKAANTAAQAFELVRSEQIALGEVVARAARQTAAQIVAGRDIAIEIALFDREQNLVGRAPFES